MGTVTIPSVSRMPSEGLLGVLSDLWTRYNDETQQKLKLIDAYLGYIMVTGIIQFAYCCLVGTFPFNSFLSGFISTVGSFVLGGISPIDYCDTIVITHCI